MPTPPTRLLMTNPARTTIGSTPSRRARPAQTPPRTPRSVSRRSGGSSTAGALTASMVAASPPVEASRQQDRAERGEHGGQCVVEMQVDGAQPVGEQQPAERDGHEPGDQRRAVD